MKTLLEMDLEFFDHNDDWSWHTQSKDISKYLNNKLSFDLKQLLYRPVKTRELFKKYWTLKEHMHERKLVEKEERMLETQRRKNLEMAKQMVPSQLYKPDFFFSVKSEENLKKALDNGEIR